MRTQGKSSMNEARREWGMESRSRETRIVFGDHSGPLQGDHSFHQQASSSPSKLLYLLTPQIFSMLCPLPEGTSFLLAQVPVPLFNQQTCINTYGRAATVLDIRDAECNKGLINVSCDYGHYYNY